MEKDLRYWNQNHLMKKVLVKQIVVIFFIYHVLFDLGEVFL
jgi:hypothetical protein